jgi:ADP-heptose:LPS heptosyltransferase
MDNVVFYDLTDPRGRNPGLNHANLRSLEATAANVGSVEWALAIAQMDLVIGVDSPALHLAGTLGRPAWVLLGHVSDWCWPVATNKSPWYPTARIFRRPAPGDPDSLMESVRSALAAWLQIRRTSSRH